MIATRAGVIPLCAVNFRDPRTNLWLCCRAEYVIQVVTRSRSMYP